MVSVPAILSFIIAACAVEAFMIPIHQGCAQSSPTVKVLTYTQWLPPQIAPTSTVYDMIVTHRNYVVWCSNGAATVTNVPPSPVPSGKFTALVHSAALTVEEVQCIRPDMVLTRREIRGNEYVKRSAHMRDIEAPPTTTPKPTKPTGPPKQTGPPTPPRLPGILFPVPHKWRYEHVIQQPNAAGQMHVKRQLVPTTLSPQAAALVSQLQTAQYALELCNDNFNLTEICEILRSPATVTPLANVGVSASQAGDIVCYADVFGIDLNTTNSVLLGDLAAAVYGLELGDNYTTTSNTTRLCNSIDLHAAPYLGIDVGAVNNFICGGPSTQVTVTAVTTQTVVVVPGSPIVTFTASGVDTNTFSPTVDGSITGTFTASGVSGGLPWQSGMGTGVPNGWPNGTFPRPTEGTFTPGGVAPTGEGNPWGESTGSDSLGIDFPPASDWSHSDEPKTPMARDTPNYYPATTMETITARFGRYD